MAYHRQIRQGNLAARSRSIRLPCANKMLFAVVKASHVVMSGRNDPVSLLQPHVRLVCVHPLTQYQGVSMVGYTLPTTGLSEPNRGRLQLATTIFRSVAG